MDHNNIVRIHGHVHDHMLDDDYIIHIQEQILREANARRRILTESHQQSKKAIIRGSVYDGCIIIIGIILLILYGNNESNKLIVNWLIMNIVLVLCSRIFGTVYIIKKFRRIFNNQRENSCDRALELTLGITIIINFVIKLYGSYVYFSAISYTPLGIWTLILLILFYIQTVLLLGSICWAIILYCKIQYDAYIAHQHLARQPPPPMRPLNNLDQQQMEALINNIFASMFDNNVGNNEMSDEQIEQLPVTKYEKNSTGPIEIEKCSICLSEFDTDDELLILGCTHKFHKSCASTWFKVKGTCPTCRTAVLTGFN
jgi:hypothetical protein